MLSPIIFSILIGLLTLAALVLWIFALVDCLRQPWETGKKVIWILVLIFVQGLGALIYFGVQKKWKYFVFYLVTVGLIIPLILIGVVFSSVDSARQQARETKAKSDLNDIMMAYEMCYSAGYTGNAETSGAVTCGGVTYLQNIPSPPTEAWNYKFDTENNCGAGNGNPKYNNYCIRATGFSGGGTFDCKDGECGKDFMNN